MNEQDLDLDNLDNLLEETTAAKAARAKSKF